MRNIFTIYKERLNRKNQEIKAVAEKNRAWISVFTLLGIGIAFLTNAKAGCYQQDRLSGISEAWHRKADPEDRNRSSSREGYPVWLLAVRDPGARTYDLLWPLLHLADQPGTDRCHSVRVSCGISDGVGTVKGAVPDEGTPAFQSGEAESFPGSGIYGDGGFPDGTAVSRRAGKGVPGGK